MDDDDEKSLSPHDHKISFVSKFKESLKNQKNKKETSMFSTQDSRK